MVSTRLMSITGHNGADGSGATETHSAESSSSPAKSTRASTSNHIKQGSSTSKLNFVDLPPEIVEKIFGYLNYKNVCQLRFVCRRFDQVCGQILNTSFLRLQHHLLERFHDIKRKMPRRESARRNHHLACESDIIETLHMRLTLLQMSLGKHIERKHCCFFPGEILDEALHILHYIKVTPKLAPPYKVTDELFDLSTMAMEYFKEKIEPDLPEIAYFSTDFLEFSGSFPSTGPKNFLMDSFSIDMEEGKENPNQSMEASTPEASPEVAPQSNIVLRKGIRKIKQGMKKYNNQLTVLRQDVRSCRQKATEQQKVMSEQQKQIAEQQKQILEYANRMDENDKKNEEISRKFGILLQELNKCKTELQYWRSKSPATPLVCNSCGNEILPSPPEELEALVNQDVNNPLEGLNDFVPVLEKELALEEEAAAAAAAAAAVIPVVMPVEKPVASTSSTKTNTNKRKMDEKEAPSASIRVPPHLKKTRRVLKGRNQRKSKV